MRAHAAFDAIWKTGLMSRTEAYQWLADRMYKTEVHIAELDVPDCQTVIKIVQDAYPNLRPIPNRNLR